MGDDSVIPESNRAGRPLPASGHVVCVGEMLAEKGEDVVRLLGVELLDALEEGWVVEERLEAGYGVCSDQGMGGGDGGSVWCSAAVDGAEIGSLYDAWLVLTATDWLAEAWKR